MREWMNRSFRWKLLRGFLLIGILPLLLCVLVLLNTFQLSLDRSTVSVGQNQVEQAAELLDEHFAACGQVLDTLADNQAVNRVLEGDPNQKGFYTLYSAVGTLLRSAEFSILDSAGQPLYATAGWPGGLALDAGWGVLNAARSSAGGTVFRLVPEGGDGAQSFCIQAAKCVRTGGDAIGYVMMLTGEENLDALLAEQYGEGMLLLLDSHWAPVWASSGMDRQAALASTLRTQLLAGEPLAGASVGYAYYTTHSDRTGFYLLLQQQQPMADWVMGLLWGVAGVAILLCLLLCVGVSMGTSNQLFKPIQELNGAMAQVEQGNLNVRLNSRRADELGQLAGRFDRMAERLQDNLDESVRHQRQLNEARIRMMQAQLNPHFLYNTLDTVKWMGKIHKAPEIATIAADLADILRSSISGEEFAPLRDELRLVERYVEIQSIRFPDEFVYQAEAEPETLDVLVPKLMLQPLVENSIVHGFQDSADGQTGHITVTAKIEDGQLAVTVRDDGAGMTPESLERFQSGDEQASRHLGLHNVDAILRLYYGADRGLTLLSPDGPGTEIRICLPVQRRGGTET